MNPQLRGDKEVFSRHAGSPDCIADGLFVAIRRRGRPGGAEILDASVYAWAIEGTVADQFNAEFGTTFLGIEREKAAVDLTVDRTAQHWAIECHRSQSRDTPVLHRRLVLQGDEELLIQLRAGGARRLTV